MNNNVHKSVLKNKDAETGCTVHLVTAEVDEGPILVQKKCCALGSDTVETLKKRVQKLEGDALIQAIKLWGKNE
jgi:phosphoribosylglycinamide formyltransferase-1